MSSRLLLITLLLLSGCVHAPVILTESEMLPVILKGTTYHALWDNKEQDFMAEQDRIAIPKGTYLKLQQEADKCK